MMYYNSLIGGRIRSSSVLCEYASTLQSGEEQVSAAALTATGRSIWSTPMMYMHRRTAVESYVHVQVQVQQ